MELAFISFWQWYHYDIWNWYRQLVTIKGTNPWGHATESRTERRKVCELHLWISMNCWIKQTWNYLTSRLIFYEIVHFPYLSQLSQGLFLADRSILTDPTRSCIQKFGSGFGLGRIIHCQASRKREVGLRTRATHSVKEGLRGLVNYGGRLHGEVELSCKSQCQERTSLDYPSEVCQVSVRD